MAEQRPVDAIQFENCLCDEAETFLKLANELAQNDPIQALKYATKCGTLLEIAQKMFTTPSIDSVPVVHGHWICTDETFNIWRCSSCREEWTLNDGTPKDNNMNYCFNCGATMDEQKEGYSDGND